MKNKDKLLVEEMTRVLEFGKNRKLKNGKTIEINIINKHKDGWSENRETFKNVDKAVKFLLDED